MYFYARAKYEYISHKMQSNLNVSDKIAMWNLIDMDICCREYSKLYGELVIRSTIYYNH